MKKAIVVGSGIIGLSATYHLWRKGYQVVLIDRYHRPVGASIRNFGMIWPVGLTDGPMYERAMRTRSHWKTLSSRS